MGARIFYVYFIIGILVVGTVSSISYASGSVQTSRGGHKESLQQQSRDLELLKDGAKVMTDNNQPSSPALSNIVTQFPPIDDGNILKQGKVKTQGPGSSGTDIRVSNVIGLSPQNEPTVAINPDSGGPLGDEQIVAGANDYRTGDSKCGVYVSSNNGASWQDAGVLPGQFRAGDGAKLDVQGDPVVRFARNGDAFYLCMAFSRTTNEEEGKGSIFLSRSTDKGLTWSDPLGVRKATTGEFNDKPWLAIDTFSDSPFRDNIYACWSQFADSGVTVNFARSTTFGKSFKPQIILSNTISAYCAMDVGPDGTVYVAWIDFSTTPEQLVVRKSTDGGATFGNLVKVSDVFSIQGSLPNNSFRVGTLPDMATARNGDVHIVWADDRFRSSGHGSDVLIASSTDEGNTWTVRVVNSQDTTNTDQFDPTIDI